MTAPPSASLWATITADHHQLQASRAKYDDRFDGADIDTSWRRVLVDAVTNVGFQQLAWFRVAAAAHRRGLAPIAMLVSRMIRHLYGAEMHWAARVAPGVLLVHGNGLVISREATVDTGCVLSQHVTLGISTGADRTSGAPHLRENVHVGPGAVLVGPISVGPDSKIAPNATVMSDVGPGLVVAPAEASVTARGGAAVR